jgi:hypothetical protein
MGVGGEGGTFLDVTGVEGWKKAKERTFDHRKRTKLEKKIQT